MAVREWPLVLFTLFGQTAAGLAAFLVLPAYLTAAKAADPAQRGARFAAAVIVLLALGAAAALSLFHLGKAGRAARSLANVGASWLSREILSQVLFMSFSAGLAAAEWGRAGTGFRIGLAAATAAVGLFYVLSMARIYMLPAVAEWNSAATPAAFLGSALVLGSMTAAVLLRKGLALAGAEASLGTSAGAERTALASIGLGYVLALLFAPGFGLLARTVRERVYPPRPGLRSFFAGRMIVLSLALAIWALALISGDPGTVRMWLALALAFGSEVVGRLLFYSIPAGL